MEGSKRDKLNIALFPTLMDLSRRTAGSVSTQEHDTSIKETRRMIFECMKNLLGDSKIVQQQLGKDAEETSQPLVVLQFVHHCACVLPQCFVSCHGNDDRSPVTPQKAEGVEVYHSNPSVFTMWVMSRLFYILSSPGCLRLHEKILEIAKAVMQLANAKDSHFFQLMILEFIGLMEDMNTLVRRHGLKVERQSFTNPIIVKRFCHELVKVEVDSSYALEVSSMEQCVLIQKYACAILQGNIPATCQYVAFALDRIWKELTFVTKVYPKEVSRCAMESLSKLCNISGCIDKTLAHELLVLLLDELKASLVQGSCNNDISADDSFWHLWNALMPVKPYGVDCPTKLRRKSILNFNGADFDYILHVITESLEEFSKTFIIAIPEESFVAGLRCLGVCYSNDVALKDLMPLIKALYSNYTKFYTNAGFVKLLNTAVVMQTSRHRSSNGETGYAKEMNTFLNHCYEGTLKEVEDLCNCFSEDKLQLISNNVLKMCGLLQIVHIRKLQETGLPTGVEPLRVSESYSTMVNKVKEKRISADNGRMLYFLFVELFGIILNVSLNHPSYLSVSGLVMNVLSSPWENTKVWEAHDWQPKYRSVVGYLTDPQSMFEWINTNSVAHILDILIQMPRNTMDSWKCFICKELLASCKTNICVQTIKAVPSFLSSISIRYHGTVVEELNRIFNKKNCELNQAIVESLGDLVCAMSGDTEIKESNVNDIVNAEHTHNTVYLHCKLCREGIGMKESVLSPFARHVIHDLKPLQAVAYKLAYVRNIKPLALHLKCYGSAEETSQFWKPYFDLITDADRVVRAKMSKELNNFVQREDLNKFQEIIVNKLKETFLTAVTTKDVYSLQMTCLTLGNIGKVTDGDLLLVVIISLLECQLTKFPLVNAVAYEQLQEIASSKQVSSREIFERFGTNICGFVVSKFHEQLKQGKKGSYISESLTNISSAFDFKNSRMFLQHSAKVILPRVVHLRDGNASILLRNFAKCLDINRREMLLHNFKYIFPYLVCFCSGNELEESLNFLQRETDVELDSLLRSECQNTFNHLMLQLCNYRDEVFTGISILACSDGSYTGPKELRSNRERALYIHSRLLGALAFFNQVLTSSEETERLLVMRSLVELTKIMGPSYITPVRLKVMAILSLDIKSDDEKFLEASCDAWSCFVSNVELSALGPMLGQIIVTLLPLLDKFADKVSAIFHYLLVKNKEVLKDFFGEIHFMPDLPVLSEVNQTLKASKTTIKSSKDLKVQLLLPMKGIQHENNDVRKFALKRTADLLQENQSVLGEDERFAPWLAGISLSIRNLRNITEKVVILPFTHVLEDYLQELILGSETVDPVVVKLVGMLVGCCKGADNDTRNLIGICFGEVGAIDPGRLENLCGEKEEDILKCKGSVRDKEFAVDLINELCHAFLAAGDTRSQDCSAYAIQQSLHFYNCKSTDQNSDGYAIWHAFPEQTQEILQPHLHSNDDVWEQMCKTTLQTIRFMKLVNGKLYVHSSRNNWAKVSIPVFGSEKGRTFKEWICSLVGFQTSKVQNKDVSAVFTPCLSIIKYDLKTALFIFPHVLSHCITESAAAADEILSEVLSVLNAACEQDRENAIICAQTIFTLMDFLEQSVERQQSAESNGTEDNKERQTIQTFLQKIPKDLLAKAAFNCKSTSRALMYFESYLENDADKLQRGLRFLQELYFALNEPDGISGISAVRKGNKSLHEQITEHEASGRLLDAAACYERAIQLEDDQVMYYQGLLRSLIGLGQLNSALMNANGVITQRPNWTDDLRPYQAEAAWRLGRWDDLRDNLEPAGSGNYWSISLGKLLLDIKNKDALHFQTHLEEARKELMIPLCAACLETGAYERAYESVLRLHMLQEVEHCSSFVIPSETRNPDDIKELMKRLELRYNGTEDSFRTREPLLNLRRTLVDLLPNTESTATEKDDCWIRTAKIARKAGHYSTAFSSLLNVVESVRPDTVKEHAKLLWAQGDCHQALLRLQRGVSDIKHLDSSGKGISRFSKLSMAKVQLLIGHWMEETESYEPEPVLFHYKGIVEAYGDWEKGHFYVAKYYERLMNACEDEPTKMRKPDFVKFVVRHYATSLQYGSKWIYQSMPKLLSLWLDFGMKAWTIDQDKSMKHSEKSYYREKLHNVNEAMASYSKALPAYQFLSAFSQLISRICHPNPSVWNLLEEIISRLLSTYKQQAIWNMVSVSKSSFKTRSFRCHQIFSNVSKRNGEMRKFIDDVINLTDRLLEIANKKVAREQKLSISKDFGILKRMLADRNFSPIIIPLQSTMTVTLPSGSGSHHSFSPFPESLPFFASIEDSIGVLHSLQKPKKIMIRGSDGSVHPMMCKPKDDLRKDCRLMEFNSLVNKLLLKDADCRRRQLHIRTYAVIPLNEECGVLEWVQNTTGLRHILNQLYKEKQILMKVSELKRIYDMMNSSDIESRVHAFQNQVLPRIFIVVPCAFLVILMSSLDIRKPETVTISVVTNFNNLMMTVMFVAIIVVIVKRRRSEALYSDLRYMARLAYCRTSAVISMVGYTLGLGDRHGENILYDSTTGDCVHVDFNCLFNKGQTFDFPEKVPFRLTHNMVAAMGPLGYEGIYRRACEVTLKLMRNQRDSLLSVLHSFLYDPLVEWTKDRRKQVADSGEVTNEKAVKILKDIEQRLRGYYSGMTIRLPLSIEGHVHQLIKEATDLENLSQMYIGWAAYL